GILQPSSVLAVTFTNRAAGEMRGRLRQLGAVGPDAPETGSTPNTQAPWSGPPLPSRSAAPARTAARPAGTAPAPRPNGLTPLPRRVPQTSLAAELREEASAQAVEDDAADFTAEHAASSLAGFQRGTFEARDDDAGSDDGCVRPAADDAMTASPGVPTEVPAASRDLSTPPDDR
ncbi:UvrD-helicase domain-containing protein, partial [Streptomyces sp. NPDC007000]|uniref:UvrD-helicase domain-containing protein n=1 Tax=Streptomyces sp. NPDC007000 TaxID=3155357 RepID=UPI0033EB187B